MLRVFVSWSGERSRLMAKAVTNWLPLVIHAAKPWMSDENLPKGELWTTGLSRNLADHKLGILCVTPENYQSPWLLFEAGALSKLIGDAKVCPLILGMTPNELEGPLGTFQATVFEKDDVYKLIKSLNDELEEEKVPEHILHHTFETFWPELERQVIEISKIKISGTTSEVLSAVRAFAKYGLPEPRIGALAYFSSGFESHALYSTITSIATRRLYIFGRKNRKLFDKEHKDFFQGLSEKIQTGFDFRVLFLDPEAPEAIITEAHKDEDFDQQLQHYIARARTVMEQYNLDVSTCFRKYKERRRHAMMIADDAVVYTRIPYGHDGRVQPLTKAQFNVVNATSVIGSDMIEEFLDSWSAANPF